MYGQGSPRTGWLYRACGARRRCCALLAWFVLLAAQPATAADLDIRLRIAWGGGESSVWQGLIRTTSGTLSPTLNDNIGIGYLDTELAAEGTEFNVEIRGRMVGAKYRLEGNIVSIVKQVKSAKDVYYKLNLQLWNIRNGLLEWSDEKEIRKTTTRG